MIQQLGQQIRELRIRKGIGLNDFAKELDVSTGYLSNLETGKSDTIKLDVLERIQRELMILPLVTFPTSYSQRIGRIEQNIVELEHIDPLYAEYLIQNMETGIEWFIKQSKSRLDD